MSEGRGDVCGLAVQLATVLLTQDRVTAHRGRSAAASTTNRDRAFICCFRKSSEVDSYCDGDQQQQQPERAVLQGSLPVTATQPNEPHRQPATLEASVCLPRGRMALLSAVHPQRWHCLHTAARLSYFRARFGTTSIYQRIGTASTSSVALNTPHSINLQHTVPGAMVQDSITLTSEERALFDTLLAASQFAGTGTVLRAAGGWVRDKLLGKESKDIDIALDNMLGKDFADKVSYEWASSHSTCGRCLMWQLWSLSSGSNRSLIHAPAPTI